MKTAKNSPASIGSNPVESTADVLGEGDAMGYLTCYKDGCSQFWVQDGVEQRFRKTGESFYCPFGHGQHFKLGPDPKDAIIKQLEARCKSWESNCDRTYQMYKRTEDQRVTLFRSLMAELKRRGAGVYRTAAGYAWVAPCQRGSTRLAKTEKDARARQVAHERKHACRK